MPPSRRSPGWPLLAIVAFGIAGIVLAWFAFGRSLTTSDNGPPSRYVEAVVGEPARINPLFAYLNDADRDLTSLIFSGLTRLGPNGQVLPDLAESWDVAPDGKSVTFHLRHGVTWHTSVAFTSADVIFTYHLLADPKLEVDPDQASLWRQVNCTAPDDFTVTCALPEPFSPFMAYTTIGIIPRHILESTDAAALFNNSFNQAPVGTGPYRLAQYDRSRIVLKANANYYLGAPHIPEIDLRFYPDTASATTGAIRGEVDGLLLDSAASQDNFDALASAGRLKQYTADRSAYTILYLNNSQPPLNEKPVRIAIAETIDIDSIISKVLGGRAVRDDSPIVPGTWAYDPNLTPYPHDVGNARHLLDDAGWKLPDGQDVRSRDGTDLNISLVTDQDPLRGAVADAIAQQLRDSGIGATVDREDSSKLIQAYLIPRKYQAAIFGWEPGPDPDPYPAWHSSQTAGNGRNLAAFANDSADKALEDARRTWDIPGRQQLYYTFQDIFHSETPSVILYCPVYTYFVTDQIKGVQLGTMFGTGSRFRNVQDWTFDRTASSPAP